MRILVVSPHFPPETAFAAQRMKQLGQAWARAGHEVHVVAGPAEIPVQRQGRRSDRLYHHEHRDGVHVHRLPIELEPKGRLGAGLSHGAFAVRLVTTALTRIGRPDVSVVSVPPATDVATAALMSTCWRVPLVIDLGQAPCGTTPTQTSMECRARWRVIGRLCRLARRTAAASPAFVRSLRQSGLDDARIEIVPDGADVDFWRPGPPDPAVRAQLGARPGQSLVVYAGSLGRTQDVSTFVAAASRLGPRSDIHCAIVGAGPEKAAIVRRLRAVNADLSIHDAVTRDRLLSIYHAADVAVVPQRIDPMLEGCVPSKLYEILACGRPVVAAVGSAGAAVVRASEGGLVVPPGDSRRLANGIKRLVDDPDLRRRMGLAGRMFVEQNYRWSSVAQRYLDLLDEAIAPPERETFPTTDPIMTALNLAVARDATNRPSWDQR